jgi:hypothetical protein
MHRIMLSALAGSAVWRNGVSSAVADAATTGDDPIADDAYFYGQSPPVYPSRESDSAVEPRYPKPKLMA